MHGCQSNPKCICLNSWKLDISEEKWCSASSSMIFFLSLITLVQLVLSGIRQTWLWVSRWLRLMTVRDSSCWEDKFILISSPFRDGTVALSGEPSVCLCLSVGSPVYLCFPVRKCVEIASGCLHRGGCVETHYWDTSRVNISCLIWSAMLLTGWALKCVCFFILSRYCLAGVKSLPNETRTSR